MHATHENGNKGEKQKGGIILPSARARLHLHSNSQRIVYELEGIFQFVWLLCGNDKQFCIEFGDYRVNMPNKQN